MAAGTITLTQPTRAGGPQAVPQLFLLLAGDRPLDPPSRHRLDEVDRVLLGRHAVRAHERRRGGGLRRLELSLPDPAMSATHATVQCVQGRWLFEDQGSKNGSRVNGLPCARALLADGDLVEVGQSFFLFRDAQPPAPGPEDANGAELGAPAELLTTFDGTLARAYAGVAAIAGSTLPVLLRGDTGTGKEVVARAVHELSRRPGAFVPVNCGALPPTLVEAALFGHRKGAFTGATDDRPGFVGAAADGTLFLDEIAELPAAAQATLLRVLQDGEVVAIGESRPRRIDLRVIAASHGDLGELVRAGRFREDLHARLAGFELTLPPLAQRKEDLGLLIAALLRRMSPPVVELRLAPAAARALLLHDWPRNVRELDLALRSAVVLAAGRRIELEHLPAAVQAAGAEPIEPATPFSPDEEALRDRLVEALREHAGNVAAVGRAMGKGRMQIHRWLKRFGLDLASYRE